MFENLEILRASMGLAAHAARRQSLVAQNIANADTPGYHARDLATFSESYNSPDVPTMRATRAEHLSSGDLGFTSRAQEVLRPGAASPNGNTVSLELEMMTAADVKSEHTRALTVYQKSLDILRTSLGRGR